EQGVKRHLGDLAEHDVPHVERGTLTLRPLLLLVLLLPFAFLATALAFLLLGAGRTVRVRSRRRIRRSRVAILRVAAVLAVRFVPLAVRVGGLLASARPCRRCGAPARRERVLLLPPPTPTTLLGSSFPRRRGCGISRRRRSFARSGRSITAGVGLG